MLMRMVKKALHTLPHTYNGEILWMWIISYLPSFWDFGVIKE
jgi:hypothetical protein